MSTEKVIVRIIRGELTHIKFSYRGTHISFKFSMEDAMKGIFNLQDIESDCEFKLTHEKGEVDGIYLGCYIYMIEMTKCSDGFNFGLQFHDGEDMCEGDIWFCKGFKASRNFNVKYVAQF